MTNKIEYIKDIVGNNYIGVNIYVDMVQPYLERLKDIIGDEYDIYVKNQQNRDHGHYHITVINVMEYNRLCTEIGIDKFVNSLESSFDFEFNDLKLMGIGTVERSGNRAYFIVVKSDQLQEARKKYGLPEQDFHITLGFKYKDVFGVRKNEVIKEYSSFLRIIKKLYYSNNESFSFIKEVENYDLDPDGEVIPIKIEDTSITFRVDNTYFQVSFLDKLWIISKWQDNKELPVIPNTIISKKFKDI
jgi:hypothetical protein